jgi:hypothetical protein
MTEIQINKLKKRDVVTQLEKLVSISRASLLKLSKNELVGLLKEKIDSQSDEKSKPESVKQPKAEHKVKSKRPNKKRLLDFSSDDEDEPDEPEEIVETIEPVKEPVKEVIEPVPDTQVAKKQNPKPKSVKQPKKKKQVIQFEDESEDEVKEPEVKEPEVKELKEKTKLMKEIKSEIKTLMKDFSSNISKTIVEFKKSDDQIILIDTHNELRSEYESEVKLILDENKGKVTDALLDYVDSLFTTQFNRVDRLL